MMTWIGLSSDSNFPYWNVWNWTIFVSGLPPLLHLIGFATGNRLPFFFSAGIMWWALPQLLQICIDASANVIIVGIVFQLITGLGSFFLHPELAKIDFKDMTKAKWIVLGVVFVFTLLSIIVGGLNVAQVEALPEYSFINGSLYINATSERATPYLGAMFQSGLTGVYFSTAYVAGMEPEMYIALFTASQLLSTSFSIAVPRGDVFLSSGLWEIIRARSIAAGSFYFFLSLIVLIVSGLWISKKRERDNDQPAVSGESEDGSAKARAKNWIAGLLYLCCGLSLIGAILIWVFETFPQYGWLAFALFTSVLLTVPAYILGSSLPYLVSYGLFVSAFGGLTYGMRFANTSITGGAALMLIPCFLVWISFPFQYDHEVDNRMRIYALATAGVIFCGSIVASIGSIDTPYFADEISARGSLTALFFVGAVLGQNKEFSVLPFALGSLLVHSFGGCYAINSNTGQAGSILIWLGTLGMIVVFYRKLVSSGALVTSVVTNETAPILSNDFPPAVPASTEETPITSEPQEENVTL